MMDKYVQKNSVCKYGVRVLQRRYRISVRVMYIPYIGTYVLCTSMYIPRYICTYRTRNTYHSSRVNGYEIVSSETLIANWNFVTAEKCEKTMLLRVRLVFHSQR